MKIESRVQDIAQEVRANELKGSSVRRQQSVTSESKDDASTKKPIVFLTDEPKVSIKKAAMPVPEPIDVHKAMEMLNKIAQEQKKDISFSVDKESKASVIKVFRTHTGELIKQFPPEEILAMKARIRKSTGLFFDSKG